MIERVRSTTTGRARSASSLVAGLLASGLLCAGLVFGSSSCSEPDGGETSSEAASQAKAVEGAQSDRPDDDIDDPLAGHEFPAPSDAPSGRWRKARSLQEEISDLEGIGYASGYEPAPVERGVTINTNNAWGGYNLYVSGHGPEAILTDMQGDELHRWRGPFDEVLPDFKRQLGSRKKYRDFWRRAHLYPNGDLLAIFEGHALIKLDRDSNVKWTYSGLAHHDLDVLPDGRIFLLTRKGKLIPRIDPDSAVLEDYVVVLDSKGKRRQKVSIFECFENSEFAHFLDRAEARGDFFHTNTIEVLDGSLADRPPAFKKGNVLVSILRLSTIAILDLQAERVVWALAEGWVEQHQPTMLDSGAMMLFDNLGGDEEFGRTRVMEFDPIEYKEQWTYEGNANNHFQSDRCGSCQRLPNGNTLITESDNGRAFEVTKDKQIVWEFLNPNGAGDDETLIATLFEVVRLPEDFPVDWTDRESAKTE